MDAQAVRRHTPGIDGRQVFLDSAGSSLPPQVVLDTVTGHVRREAEIGGYRAAGERAEDLEAVRSSVAALLNAAPETISLTDSATRSWLDFVSAVKFRPGDRVLVTEVEYHSNALQFLHSGIPFDVIPGDTDGALDLAALDRMLDGQVAMVSLVHVPTNSGLVNPVREVVELAHARGALVLLDACQSAGQLVLDSAALGVDGLTGTGRKWLRGPRGNGFLYVRPEIADRLRPAVVDGHSAQWVSERELRLHEDGRRFELWEYDVAARLGLGAAVDYLIELGPEQVEQAVRARAERLRTGLSTLGGVTVRDPGRDRCGIVTFTVDGVAPADVRTALAHHDVTVTTSGRGSAMIDMDRRGIDAVTRASPHYFVSDDELDRAVASVAEIADGRRH
ncbi:MAG: aminotransferase class V-fold PLP-dependent enzyme [Pseudonocardiaceae bacterium]|nr:aminotransferase class V-fold PLP-dependent enzyme [Pseudonocardiaceae bacterium]